MLVCVCVCARARVCVRACVCVCACVCEGGIRYSDVLLFVLSAVNSQVYRSCAAIPALQGQHMNTLKKCLFPVSMNFPKTSQRQV